MPGGAKVLKAEAQREGQIEMPQGKQIVKLPPQRGEIKKMIYADLKKTLKKAGNVVLFTVRLQNSTRQYKLSEKATRKCCSIAMATMSFSLSGCCPKDETTQRLLESRPADNVLKTMKIT